jgi:hypothetical protein
VKDLAKATLAWLAMIALPIGAFVGFTQAAHHGLAVNALAAVGFVLLVIVCGWAMKN